MGAGGLALFLWSMRSGQFEDLDGAAQRILFDNEPRSGDTSDGRRLLATSDPDGAL